ncbi:MAG: leucine-rich repeat domain-containing protein [Coriobacteriia bacterium]|nr:leucine-rich repeat domain-containing protein [Coriobacteriia bacterium]
MRERSLGRGLWALAVAMLMLFGAAVTLAAPACVESAEAVVYPRPSGSCGDGLTYQLKDYTLTISGTGDMADCTGSADWMGESTRDVAKCLVTKVVVEEGCTSVGRLAFNEFERLTQIQLPSTLTKIGHGAFCNNTSLTSINLPAGLKSVGDMAFFGCRGLTGLQLPSGLADIGVDAFRDCENLSFDLPDSVVSIGAYAFQGAGDVVVRSALVGALVRKAKTPEKQIQRLYDGAYPEGSGQCGPDLSWRLEDRVLTVSGTGAMDDFDESGAPWAQISHDPTPQDSIRKVVVGRAAPASALSPSANSPAWSPSAFPARCDPWAAGRSSKRATASLS